MKPQYKVYRVFENLNIAGGIYKLTIAGDFRGTPGQFYMLRAWDFEPVLSRPISINDIDNGKISFVYQVIGRGTDILSKLQPKDEIKVMGPCGNGFELSKIKGHVAVVSGGMGIAPMKYLCKILEGKNVDLYCGFKDEVYVAEDIKKHVKNISVTTETGKSGTKGYITDIFNPKGYDIVLCCGPEIMMKKVVESCKMADVPIYISMEKRMACGIGACLVCTCKTKGGVKRTCKDGPVFLGSEVVFND